MCLAEYVYFSYIDRITVILLDNYYQVTVNLDNGTIV